MYVLFVVTFSEPFPSYPFNPVIIYFLLDLNSYVFFSITNLHLSTLLFLSITPP